MNADRHAQVKAIFLEACALPPEKRGAFLSQACTNDADLRGEVERLLSHHAANADAGRAKGKPDTDVATHVRDALADMEAPHFSTGHLIADRYRVVSLLGEGGMGRVYRAEDLRLNLTVALKFMPRFANLDPVWRRRMESEVKLSRAVSHSNVCRVFDLDEIDDIPFISMEFVEGEDLSSLLRRIERLTGDRAVAIARQICAGLSASHAQGVLHRDLKPSNIMLDGNGNVRITDFGLAVVAGRPDRAELPAGTPRYMAPELFSGVPATEQSDIYALGLVLYEMFTGKPVFTAQGAAEYSRLHRKEEPAPPSAIEPGIDSRVEAVILSCLRKDPAERPASVLHVAAALPGGDLLAAALAAGEIPTRELLAAAAATGSLSRRSTARIAIATLGLLIVALFAGIGTHPITRQGGVKAPEVLREQARAIAVMAGLTDPPVDSDIRYLSETEIEMFGEAGGVAGSRAILTRHDDAPLFCYRESHSGSIPSNVDLLRYIMPGSEPLRFAPSPVGVATIVLDGSGRLVLFDSNVIRGAPVEEGLVTSNWDSIIRATGRDLQTLTPTESQLGPLSGADQAVAYVSPDGGDSSVAARIEMITAQNRLRLLGFFIDAPSDALPAHAANAARWTFVKTIRNSVLLVLLAASLPAAWRGWKSRGDLVGAVRAGGFIFVLRLAGSLIAIRHVGAVAEAIDTLARTLASALAEAAIVAIFYLALERHVRRLWPRTLGCWSRVLNGTIRDPFVGRDVLVGCFVGCLWAIFIFLDRRLPPMLGWEARAQLRVDQSLNHLLGARPALAEAIESVRSGIYQGLALLCVLVLATWLTRQRKWLALIISWFVCSLMYAPAATHPVTAWTIYAFGCVAVAVYLLQHWGLISLLSALLVVELLGVFPITMDMSSWYAGYGLFGIAMALGLGIWAFHQSRQPSLSSVPQPSHR